MAAIKDRFTLGEIVKVKDRTYGVFKLIEWSGNSAVLHHFAFDEDDMFYKKI